MPVTVAEDKKFWVVRFDGDCGMTCVCELKRMLIEGLASGHPVRVDLDQAGQIDIAILQLLWAAEREAAHSGSGLLAKASEPIRAIARAAGFEFFPGEIVPEEIVPGEIVPGEIAAAIGPSSPARG